jgi:hypothetical protein
MSDQPQGMWGYERTDARIKVFDMFQKLNYKDTSECHIRRDNG